MGTGAYSGMHAEGWEGVGRSRTRLSRLGGIDVFWLSPGVLWRRTRRRGWGEFRSEIYRNWFVFPM